MVELLLPLVCRPVGEVDDTRGEHPGVHELQDFPVYPLLEEALSATQDDRVDHEPEFVEEPTSKQRSYEGAAADDRDVLARSPLQFDDFLRELVPFDQGRVILRKGLLQGR